MTNCPIKPLRDRVIVAYKGGAEEQTESGIILPNIQEDNSGEIVKTTVLAVGQGSFTDRGVLIPMEVKVGDTVFFERGLEDEIIIDGKSYWAVLEAELIAILKEADNG